MADRETDERLGFGTDLGQLRIWRGIEWYAVQILGQFAALYVR